MRSDNDVKRRVWRASLDLGAALALAVVVSSAGTVSAQGVDRGEVTYNRYCSSCHGVRGDGRGPAARFYRNPPPRDFTIGGFRVSQTPPGSIASHDDVAYVVRQGVPSTSMPAWRGILGEQRIQDVSRYVLALTRAASDVPIPEPQIVHIPARAPAATPEAVRRGQAVYLLLKCWTCHGTHGDGDGPEASTQRTDTGRRIAPPSLTDSVWQWGGDPRNVYRTLATGLEGTPMEAIFADPMVMTRALTTLRAPVEQEVRALPDIEAEDLANMDAFIRAMPSDDAMYDMTEEEEDALFEGWRWDLVHYVRALTGDGTLRSFLGTGIEAPLYGL